MSKVAAPATELGLTGGIGSGKSTVSNMLQELGAGVIDADHISRQSTACGGEAIAPIREAFGSAFILSDGSLDRVRMRTHCFNQPAERQRLEAIIHPIVRRQSEARRESFIRTGSPLIVWDIPLLVESGTWRQKLDRVCVVDCSEATQVHRVLERARLQGNPMSEEDVRAIIRAQARRGQRLTCADVVIHNEELTLEALRQQVVELFRFVTSFGKAGQSGLSSAL